MDSDMSSDFKFDSVEKLFAIDTEPKIPFTAQVKMLRHTTDFTTFQKTLIIDLMVLYIERI